MVRSTDCRSAGVRAGEARRHFSRAAISMRSSIGVRRTPLLERVDGSRVTIELDDGRGHLIERESREREPRLRRRRRVLVTRLGDDEDEEALDPELRDRRSREREMPVVRRVEHAAENPLYCHSSSSSPTSTWVPGLIPRPRRASSSSSGAGGAPTTR